MGTHGAFGHNKLRFEDGFRLQEKRLSACSGQLSALKRMNRQTAKKKADLLLYRILNMGKKGQHTWDRCRKNGIE
jgi:hypothetical protein